MNSEYRLMPVKLLPAIAESIKRYNFMPDAVWGDIIAAFDRVSPAAPERSETPADDYVMAPHYRGYASLGTGQYLLNNSRADHAASLIISVATEAEKAGRVVGDERDNEPDAVFQPEAMAVRIDFTSVAGLDALENQLRKLRAEHFPAPTVSSSAAPSEVKVIDIGHGATLQRQLKTTGAVGWLMYNEHGLVRSLTATEIHLVESSLAAASVQAVAAGQESPTKTIEMKPWRTQKWLTSELLHHAPSAEFVRVRGADGAQLEHPGGGPLTWVRCPRTDAVGVVRIDGKWHWQLALSGDTAAQGGK